jgi:NAD(P)-dependent dehydrogenase (short-subunit alcohol dehydrogenase family)
MGRHENTVAVVTGGTQGVGLAICRRLVAEGARSLVICGRNAARGEQAAAELVALGAQCRYVQADMAQAEDCVRVVETGLDIYGRVNALVNSAATSVRGGLLDTDLALWEEIMAVNLRAPFLLAQQAAKRMTAGGLIVNITDIGAQKAWSRYPSYSVSKAGLESLTKLLARALAPSIRVNAIAPGLVLPSDVVTQEQWDKLVQKLPLKRAATLDEITSALEFLIKNEYITGQTIVVDGGYSLV